MPLRRLDARALLLRPTSSSSSSSSSAAAAAAAAAALPRSVLAKAVQGIKPTSHSSMRQLQGNASRRRGADLGYARQVAAVEGGLLISAPLGK